MQGAGGLHGGAASGRVEETDPWPKAERDFSKEDTQTVNKHIKPSLIIREMQNKTTVRYHFTSIHVSKPL